MEALPPTPCALHCCPAALPHCSSLHCWFGLEMSFLGGCNPGSAAAVSSSLQDFPSAFLRGSGPPILALSLMSGVRTGSYPSKAITGGSR